MLAKHFTTRPDGLPGNEDTGTMSAWAVFSMMGIYPYCPGVPAYAITAPVFDRVTIHLDPRYYGKSELVITAPGASNPNAYVRSVKCGGKALGGFIVDHDRLVSAGTLELQMK